MLTCGCSNRLSCGSYIAHSQRLHTGCLYGGNESCLAGRAQIHAGASQHLRKMAAKQSRRRHLALAIATPAALAYVSCVYFQCADSTSGSKSSAKGFHIRRGVCPAQKPRSTRVQGSTCVSTLNVESRDMPGCNASFMLYRMCVACALSMHHQACPQASACWSWARLAWASAPRGRPCAPLPSAPAPCSACHCSNILHFSCEDSRCSCIAGPFGYQTRKQ